MRTKKSLISLTVLVFVLIMGLCACKRVKDVSVGLVMAKNNCFPKVKLENIFTDESDSIYQEVYNALYGYNSVSFVVSDGKPYLAGQCYLQKSDSTLSSGNRKSDTEEGIQSVMKTMVLTEPKTSGSDWLSAVRLCADTLHTKTSEYKTMIIFDNFISTIYPLNYAEYPTLLKADPEQIVSVLASEYAIPDLEGIDVIVYGLGQTAGEQEDLDTVTFKNLTDIVEAILKAGNAKSVTFNKVVVGDEDPDYNVSCPTVPIIVDSLDMGSILPEVVRFDEASGVKFVANDWEYAEDSAAEEALSSSANLLKADPSKKVFLIGMTEFYDDRNLSEKRAQACRDTLVGLGVDPNQITCVGFGNRDNILRSENGVENRAVFMVLKDSETAKRLNLSW